MKKKIIQLTIFQTVTTSDEVLFWKQFKVVVDKLKQQGFRSICQNWWRSRYSEYIEVPGNSPNKNGYEYQKRAALAWLHIWNKHKLEITSYKKS